MFDTNDSTSSKAERLRAVRQQNPHRSFRSLIFASSIVLGVLCLPVGSAFAQDAEPPDEAPPTSAPEASSAGDGQSAAPLEEESDTAANPDVEAEQATAQEASPVLNSRITSQPDEATQVGRPAEFTVSFDLPEGFQWLSIRPSGNRFVEFLGNDEPTTDGQSSAVKVNVVVYRPGEYQIEGFELTYLTPDGTQRQESTQPVAIEVGSVIANEQDPQLAAPGPFRMVRTHNPVPLYVLAGALVALIGFLLFRVFRKPEPEDIEIVPQRPAHELALEALDRLETRELLDAGQHLEFHMILSVILREFVGRRYGFHAPEMTTTEIRLALENRQKDVGSYAEEIVVVLGEADVVKFAKGAPPTDESRELVVRTRELIEEIAARELQELNDVPSPLSGEVRDGDADEEPSYDDISHDESESETSPPSALDDHPDERAVNPPAASRGPKPSPTATDERKPRETLPFGPSNAHQPRERRVAPENVIAFGDRAAAKKAPPSQGPPAAPQDRQDPPKPPPGPPPTPSTNDDSGDTKSDSLATLRERLRSARKEDRDD